MGKKKGKQPADAEARVEDTKAADKEVKSSFPAKTLINNYGFIFLKQKWLEELGWAKGAKITLEKNADGSLTVRKA